MFVSAVTMARGRFAHDRREPFSKLWRPMGIVPFNPMENQPCHAKSSSLSQLRPRLPFLPLPQARPMPTGSAAAVSVAVTAVASAAWAVGRLRPLRPQQLLSSRPLGPLESLESLESLASLGLLSSPLVLARLRVRRVRRVGAGGGAVSGPIATPTPGPCTCLTKTYTQDGLVVFADLCTKELASAPVGGTNSSEAAPQDPRSGG